MLLSKIGYQKFIKAYWLLRITFGLLFLLVGIDKFFNYLVNWQQFIGSFMIDIMPVSPIILIRFFGLYQIILGFFLFSRWTLLSAYAAMGTLVFIFFNLFGTKDYCIVIGHDFVMILLATMLIFFTKIEYEVHNKKECLKPEFERVFSV